MASRGLHTLDASPQLISSRVTVCASFGTLQFDVWSNQLGILSLKSQTSRFAALELPHTSYDLHNQPTGF
jgi:hypothetical protein